MQMLGINTDVYSSLTKVDYSKKRNHKCVIY